MLQLKEKKCEEISTTYTSIKWTGSTTLIVGGSVLAGIDEIKFVNCKNLKAHYFPGFTIYDMQCKIEIIIIIKQLLRVIRED